MKSFDKKISSLLKEAENSGVFTGSSVGIYLNYSNGSKKILIRSGLSQLYPRKSLLKEGTFFDLASLTKPLSTVLSLLTLLNSEIISTDDQISKYFPEITDDEKKKITIKQLLNHSSGLPAYRPYFLQLEQSRPEARRAELIRLILAEPLASKPGVKTIYSDLGFLLLGFLLEKLTATNLAQCFRQRVAAPLHLSSGIFYNQLPARRRGTYAATENCPWRGRVLRGEVSDENCWALGGVAGHAGLFGRLAEVLDLVVAVLEIWQGRLTHPLIDREQLTAFLTAKSADPASSWSLGFDRPSPGSSSSGRYLSSSSVGHLGFTGTSFWLDPERDLAMVLLTNRVHPSRENNQIKEFRPYFHDRVIELLGLV